MTQLSRSRLACAIAFALLPMTICAAAPETANQNTYQVEMIVFSELTPDTLQSENWPLIQPADYPMTDTNDPRYQSFLDQIQFQSVPNTQFNLNKEQQKIESSPSLQLIAHMAWQESVPNAKQVMPIRVFGGNVYDQQGHVLASNDADQDPQLAATNPVWQLSGDITISLNHYFDTRFNLLFAEPKTTLPAAIQQYTTNSPFTYFHLLQTRRTKSGELNYIDNPLYRVLFIIKKINAS